MNSIAAFAPWVGSACCCLAFFVLLIVISAFLFRSRKPTPDEIDGLPAAPGSGVQTRASLTQLEYEPTQRTPRPSPIPGVSAAKKTVPPVASVARAPNPNPPFQVAPSTLPSNDPEDEGAMTSVMDRGRQPELPPPPPPGTITLSPSSAPLVRSRMLEPKPTISPGPDGLPPPLPKPEES